MNLVSQYFENSYEIKAKTLNTLVIENTEHFANFLRTLIEVSNKGSEEIELIDDYKKIDISKTTDIIFDLFNIEANAAPILKKLYTELEEDLCSEDMYIKKLEMESAVANIVDELTYRSRFSLKSDEINYQNFFKALSVEFDYEKTSILDRLIEYIKVSSELLNKKLFIIVNLDSFLTEEDIVELSKFLCYNEIRVLALQNKITRQVRTCEHLRIIDQDLCEI